MQIYFMHTRIQLRTWRGDNVTESTQEMHKTKISSHGTVDRPELRITHIARYYTNNACMTRRGKKKRTQYMICMTGHYLTLVDKIMFRNRCNLYLINKLEHCPLFHQFIYFDIFVYLFIFAYSLFPEVSSRRHKMHIPEVKRHSMQSFRNQLPT